MVRDGGETLREPASRQETQGWAWQPGHEDLTLEEEANQGGVQALDSDMGQEEGDDFEEMIAGWLEFFQEVNSLPNLYIPRLVNHVINHSVSSEHE
eukprot:2146758-Heterocapsa_arctica.AAC.1